MIKESKVTKLTNFGVFVELENNLEGLLHISELTDKKIADPEEIVSVGDEIEVKVLRTDSDERKIGRVRVEVLPPEDSVSKEEPGRPDKMLQG